MLSFLYTNFNFISTCVVATIKAVEPILVIALFTIPTYLMRLFFTKLSTKDDY